MQIREWQNLNTQRRYPFTELSAEAARQTFQIPNDFFRGLLITVAPVNPTFIFLSQIVYNVNTDAFTLTFKDGNAAVILSGTFARRVGGISNVGQKRYSLDAPRSLIWVPGEDWDNPTASGFVDGVPVHYSPTVTRLEASVVQTEIQSVTEVLLDAPYYLSGTKILTKEVASDPLALEPGRVVTLKAGYNIDFTRSSYSTLELEVSPGAGEGLAPCPDNPCRAPILRINGSTPDSNGNLNLELVDCLRQGASDDVDEITQAPLNNGFRIFSDCVPCCTCKDYNNVSRAISRQSAKLRDANDELNKGVICLQSEYDGAADKLAGNLSGLIEVSDVQIYPSRLYFTVRNITSVPVYAVIAVAIPEGADIELLPGQAHVMVGIQTQSPPLKNLTGGPDTGFNDPTDVDGWRSLGYYLTIGGDASFNPLGGGKGVRVCLWSPSAEQKLGDLEDVCDALSAYYSTNSNALENDSEYQGYSAELTALTLMDADCFTPSELLGTELIEHEYKCTVQEQAMTIRRQELMDQMYARRLEVAFGIDICGSSVVLAQLSTLLSNIKSLPSLVGSTCKDASYTCNAGDCTSPLIDTQACLAAIRKQTSDRDTYYSDLDTLLNEQETALNAALRDCLGDGMFADLMPTFDISVSAIYGSLNFGCKAFNGQFLIERHSPEGDTGYDCLEEIVAVYTLGTQS